MSTAPTTSPWAVQHQGTRLLIDGPTGAVAHIPYIDQDAQRAAALIASAPLLLSALQLSLQLMGRMQAELDSLQPPDEKTFNGIDLEYQTLVRWATKIINQAKGGKRRRPTMKPSNKACVEAKDRAHRIRDALQGIEAIAGSVTLADSDGFMALTDQQQRAFLHALFRQAQEAAKEAEALSEQLEALL